MDLTELIAWFEEAPTDVARLRALGGSLGLELTRRRLDHLARAMAALADAARAPALARAQLTATADPTFQAGYLTAVEDMVRAYQAELGEEDTEREILHYAKTEPYKSALLALADGAETPTEVALTMGRHKSSASRALAALREAGLVAGYAAPDSNERQRPHALTRRGKNIVEGARAGGARRGDVTRSRSSSSEKAAAKKRTPGKGNRAPVAARRTGR
ncbi:MAG: MarR family transcriptional regulator [Myxococcales bacterium]|nr:MarR family transcriptional regulator [Myxococcales bacterium]